MDAYRLDDKYVLRFDLPGVDTDAIEVTAERNTLTVKARRGVESPEGAEFVVDERPSGTYARQVVLGDGLDVESVQADCHNGVLTVTIPVAEKAKPRRIAVGRGGFGDQKVIEGSTSEQTAST